MLSMKGISKDYGPVRVLNNVDFELRSGEIHALLGSNGAGKSTLIKILGGVVSASNGTIELNGMRLDVGSPRQSLEAGIAIVHQETDLVPELSVAENIFLGLERRVTNGDRKLLFAPIDRSRIDVEARQLLEDYGLDLDSTMRVVDLAPSGQQLVQIARVLALNSDVVVFDEPTARLGPQDRDRLFKIFAMLRQRGKKIIFVTHYLDEVLLTADRATIMRDGKLVRTLDVSSTNVAEISRLMVGDDVIVPQRDQSRKKGEVILRVEGASDTGAYERVSLDIAGGEIVGLLGHLGSGRHEFSRYIARDHKLDKHSSEGINGFVPEDRRSEGIFPQLALFENIGIGLLTGRGLFSLTPRRKMLAKTQELIRQLQIKTAGSDQIISELSGGNQQKAVFARSLILDPDLYVIECPTVGVDVKAGAELHAAIFALAERGAAVLLSTDDLDEAIRLCDRIVVMRKGRISQELLPHDFSRQALVVAMGAA